MLRDVVEVQSRPEHHIFVRFDDGIAGEVDVAALVQFTGVFEPLRDPASFAQVQVLPDLGTVGWPGGADLDPLVLYAAVTGRQVELPQLAALT